MTPQERDAWIYYLEFGEWPMEISVTFEDEGRFGKRTPRPCPYAL